MALTLTRSAVSLTRGAANRRSVTQTPLAARSRPNAPGVPNRTVVMKAAEEQDFDAYLNKMAEKFEKAENKPVVIGYAAAAIFAFFTAEWLIHLPALDILLGFPVQLVGLLTLPYLAVRWFVDGGDAGKDIEEAAGTIIKKLPGLDKK